MNIVYRCVIAILAIACSQPIYAQTSYQWRQSSQVTGLPWATTWRNSPHEVAAAYCTFLGAPIEPGQSNGIFLQSCSFAVNSNGWPKGNIRTISIKQTNCNLPGGCQQTLQNGTLSQMLTMSHVDEYYVSALPLAPTLGGPTCNGVGDPINPASCGVIHSEMDINAAGGELSFKRYYNSTSSSNGDMSAGWTHSFGSRLEIKYQAITYRPYIAGNPDNSSLYPNPTSACVNGFAQIKARVSTWQNATASYANGVCTLTVESATIGSIPLLTNFQLNPQPTTTVVGFDARRESGGVVSFTVQGSSILASPSVTLRLESTSGGWKLTDESDNVETYDASGKLLSVTSTVGAVQTMGYDATGRLNAVTDTFGHSLTLNYDILGRLSTVTRQ